MNVAPRDMKVNDALGELRARSHLGFDDLAAFVGMLDAKAGLEEIQDAFGFSVTQVKKVSGLINDASAAVGGRASLRQILHMQAKAFTTVVDAVVNASAAASADTIDKAMERIFSAAEMSCEEILSIATAPATVTAGQIAGLIERSHRDVVATAAAITAVEAEVGRSAVMERLNKWHAAVCADLGWRVGDGVVDWNASPPAVRQPPDDPEPAPVPEPQVMQPKVERKMNLKRTSLGLRDTLFDAMDKLVAGEISPEEAKAVAGLADAICKTVRLEMDAEKMRRGEDMPEGGLPILRLGSDAS
jgi:hypothetical protein